MIIGYTQQKMLTCLLCGGRFMALPAHAPVSACPRRLPFVINPLITHTQKKLNVHQMRVRRERRTDGCNSSNLQFQKNQINFLIYFQFFFFF